MQDKSQRYYYQEAIAKEQDMMYISDFDLNIEHEKSCDSLWTDDSVCD